jgi:hypothetical protein
MIVPQTSFDTKLKRIAESINVDDNDDQKSVEQLRLYVKEIVTNSFLGEFYNNVLLVLSIFSCFHYIEQTYLNVNDSFLGSPVVELALASIFTWDWFLNCFIADHKVIFFTRCVPWSCLTGCFSVNQLFSCGVCHLVMCCCGLQFLLDDRLDDRHPYFLHVPPNVSATLGVQYCGGGGGVPPVRHANHTHFARSAPTSSLSDD